MKEYEIKVIYASKIPITTAATMHVIGMLMERELDFSVSYSDHEKNKLPPTHWVRVSITKNGSEAIYDPVASYEGIDELGKTLDSLVRQINQTKTPQPSDSVATPA